MPCLSHHRGILELLRANTAFSIIHYSFLTDGRGNYRFCLGLLSASLLFLLRKIPSENLVANHHRKESGFFEKFKQRILLLLFSEGFYSDEAFRICRTSDSSNLCHLASKDIEIYRRFAEDPILHTNKDKSPWKTSSIGSNEHHPIQLPSIRCTQLSNLDPI